MTTRNYATDAIAESKRNAGALVVVRVFTYEDEIALYEACAGVNTADDESWSEYVGEGWRVRLEGNGDPR
jgi:hypothetical protein